MDWITDVAEWWTTGVLGILLYWLPLAFCLVGYTMKCWADYRRDFENSQKRYYVPSLRVGTIVGRAVLSVVPVANLVAGVFDIAPKVFGDFIRWMERVLDKPLVRPSPIVEEDRR